MTDRALLVGINAYPGQPLNGCVNDVNDAANFLVSRLGFSSSDIRLLVDSRATTDAIKTRIAWLTAGAQVGDRLYFHYSGHGALFPIRDDAGQVTSVHDAICPVDFDWSRTHALLDDDLRASFDVVPDGVEFLFVSDSCNSGDLTKAFRRFRPRVFFPPADIAWRLRTAADLGLPISQIGHDQCALIAGCRSDQESSDAVFNGRPNGALTHYLLQTLGGADGISLALPALVAATSQQLLGGGYSQEPQLRGPKDVVARPFLAKD